MAQQKRSVLGRGLNALIPGGPAKEISVRPEDVSRDAGGIGIIASIEISRIKPNPYQPRADFDRDALEELSRSILQKGVIQPVTIRRFGPDYQLVSGERRLRAAQHAGLTNIPAYIIEVRDDAELLELAIVENIQREQLNPMEIAYAYRRLIDECHLTQEDVAHKVGKDRATVSNFLRLLKLPERVKDGLRKGSLSMGHARALININDEKAQLRLYEKILRSGFSVRRTEEASRTTKKSPKAKARVRVSKASDIHSVEEKLRHALGTKVQIRTKKGERGEIVIEYYSHEDLDRLLDLIL